MIRRNYAGEYWTKLLLDREYGWRNGAKFTKFICIHIQCSYLYSRIYLFTFNNRIYILEIYLFAFTCVFPIHDYICSHLRDIFIHIQEGGIGIFGFAVLDIFLIGFSVFVSKDFGCGYTF